jgi:hypothetical protein
LIFSPLFLTNRLMVVSVHFGSWVEFIMESVVFFESRVGLSSILVAILMALSKLLVSLELRRSMNPLRHRRERILSYSCRFSYLFFSFFSEAYLNFCPPPQLPLKFIKIA